jgi:hypothetical protein
MKLSEFTAHNTLQNVQELHKRATNITQQIINNGELDLVTNDNLEYVIRKYIQTRE